MDFKNNIVESYEIINKDEKNNFKKLNKLPYTKEIVSLSFFSSKE